MKKILTFYFLLFTFSLFAQSDLLLLYGKKEFTPASLTGLKLWLDASDASTIILDENGKVEKWLDKSGNGNDATQDDPTKRPSYTNGEVVFDGVDDHLIINDNTDINLGTSDFLFNLVYSSKNPSAVFDALLNKGTQGAGNMWYNFRINDNKINIYIADGSGTYWISFNGGALSANTYYSSTLIVDRDGTQQFFMDTTLIDTKTVSNIANITNTSNLIIGTQNAQYFHGSIKSVIFTKSLITKDEHKKLYEYLHGQVLN